MHAVLGQKKYQTQKFRTDGTRIPVTVVEVSQNPVTAMRTLDKDGYWAVQIGYGTKKHPNKPILGHIKGAKVDKAPQFLREVRFVDNADMPEVGSMVELSSVLTPGDMIDVTGTSKGKGFAGGVKRHHFKGGPRTHGQSDRERAPGSLGQTTTPGRVYKNKRMAGKMGFERVTIKNLTVADIEGNLLFIEGLVPGTPEGILMITKVGEDKRFVPLLKEAKEETVVEVVEEQAVEAPEATEEVQAPSPEESPAVESAGEEIPQEAAPAEEVAPGEEVKEETPAEAVEQPTEEVKE